LLLTPVIRSFLWGVNAADPVTFALAGAGLAVVALLACYLPALRAVKVDPVVALRNE
jgi:putative ABC transport system permease protein